VAGIDTKGRSAVYTGKHVIDRNHDPKDVVHFGGYAGHVTGRWFSVQGNTRASEACSRAAFWSCGRCRRNAESTVERIVDIRVDYAPNPFVEWRRLLKLAQASRH
jgi:uncharacterized Ntn-hydrolase superfamily protein